MNNVTAVENTYIIVLNYNGWRDTIECVSGLLLKCIKCKIVVVDNKSTDESLEQLKRNLPEQVKLIESEENRGFSAGNNIGIKFALEQNADYVLLLNNDTIITTDFISPLLNYMIQVSNCGCISSRIYYNDNRERIWYDGGDFNWFICRAIHYRFNKFQSNVTGINKAGFITGCCMLIPCDVIKKIGLMDERYFLYVEDTEYCLRIKAAGYDLYWDADSYIYHKVSASTGKLSNISMYYEIRNRLLLKKTYLNNLQKITASLYDMPFFVYKVYTKQYKIKIILKAIKDYYNNKFGKSLSM